MQAGRGEREGRKSESERDRVQIERGGRQTENTSNKRINQQQKQKNDLFLLTENEA